MDFVNKAYAQAADLFRSMSPAGRITTGLLVVVIILSLTFLFRQQSDRTDEYLFGGVVLTPSEIAALEAAFSQADLTVWDAVGNRIRVPRALKSKYMAAAYAGNALPDSLGNAWDKMLQQGNSFETRDMRELRARVTLEKDIALTLGKLRDIDAAKVNIDESTVEGFPPRKRRRAMAAVKAMGRKVLDEEQVQAIRHTVSGSAGVAPDDVTVTDLNAGSVYPGNGKDGGPTEFQNLYAAYQRQYVHLYRQIVSDALLPMYPGVKVAVNVELDKDMVNRTTSYKYDDKPTSIRSEVYTKESNSTPSTGGGRPGAVPNGVVSNAAAQVSTAQVGNESTLNESQEKQNSLVGATQVTTQKAPLSPIWITASIGVPTGYFQKVWLARNPPETGQAPKTPAPDDLKQIESETVKNIEEIVAPLLPRPPKGDSPFQPVKVVAYTETPSDLPIEPSLAANAGGWFAENWQTLGLFGLAVFGVVFLRGMVRATPTAPESSSAAAIHESIPTVVDHEPLSEEELDMDAPDNVAHALKRRFQSSGRSLREELTDLVKEDPDAAANILRLWISDAA